VLALLPVSNTNRLLKVAVTRRASWLQPVCTIQWATRLFGKIAMPCQCRLTCRIPAMLSYVGKWLRVPGTYLLRNAERGGYLSLGRASESWEMQIEGSNRFDLFAATPNTI
jgi:hypothetical protein